MHTNKCGSKCVFVCLSVSMHACTNFNRSVIMELYAHMHTTPLVHLNRYICVFKCLSAWMHIIIDTSVLMGL